MEREVYASEVRERTLQERRQSYFSKYTSVYRTDKNVRILIVPGHDEKHFGAQHDGVKEYELNRQVAVTLYELLRKEPGFSVAITSNNEGYTNIFESFFTEHENDIDEFMRQAKRSFENKIEKGKIDFEETNFHNYAPSGAAQKLYGINLWSNENDFDLVIHIHFNDYAGRYKDRNPKHNGFSIYIPDEQFKNFEMSKNFADKVFERMKEYFPVSKLEQEKSGIIESQELIAIGSKESLDAASMLIEYGYIYEPHFTNPDTRDFVMEDLARKTYLGIKDYFGEGSLDVESYVFDEDLFEKEKGWNEGNYQLQKELVKKGFFPPQGKTLNDCPVSGLFGKCTKDAVIDFQKENNLPPTGYVGELTRALLI